MTSVLRLLADDLTGALDTAAELVELAGPIHAFWHGAIPDDLPPNAALDSGTREQGQHAAAAVVGTLLPSISRSALAFKKIDSLMRGPTFAEVAACVASGLWRSTVLAPAFPFQGRITRGGAQHARDHTGHWSVVAADLVAALQTAGAPAVAGDLDRPLPAGLSVFDAETDSDLDRIVAATRDASSGILWIGTGGLAQALARHGAADHRPVPLSTRLPRPLLGLFGSDQAATRAQLAACGADWMTLRDGGPGDAARVAGRLSETGQVLASLDLPSNLPRDTAARIIADGLNRLVRTLPAPATLLVAGGETLRALCQSLGASELEVQGRLVPGVPRSILRGGAWDGVTVVSKSGAFGGSDLLHDLLRDVYHEPERMR
jgi:D-threonate/D-erythronate kinase